MTKIMLVEDDKSLREIYGVRLLAEGYQIISAGDGEEALAMAVKEKPDLILSDVMMPKISGFDMLDILRATPETKDLKVIMMTALSSEDQRTRGESLGANRYLVKSQVGIEDVVRTVHEVLADAPVSNTPKQTLFGVTAPTAAINTQPAAVPQPIGPQPVQPAAPVPQPGPQPVAVAPQPIITPTVESQPVNTTTAATQPATLQPAFQAETIPTPQPRPEPAYIPAPGYQPEPVQIPEPAYKPTQNIETIVTAQVAAPATPPPAPILPPASAPAPTSTTQLPQPTAPFSTAAPASLGDRVINPITPTEAKPDIASMMSQELNDGSETTSPQNTLQ